MEVDGIDGSQLRAALRAVFGSDEGVNGGGAEAVREFLRRRSDAAEEEAAREAQLEKEAMRGRLGPAIVQVRACVGAWRRCMEVGGGGGAAGAVPTATPLEANACVQVPHFEKEYSSSCCRRLRRERGRITRPYLLHLPCCFHVYLVCVLLSVRRSRSPDRRVVYRIHHHMMQMDASGGTSGLRLSRGGLQAESAEGFSSCRANACVYAGRWMYEVELGSGGVAQIGWCTVVTPFTLEEGVGGCCGMRTNST